MFCNYLPTVFLFFCFILLLMSCAKSGFASAEESPEAQEGTFPLFVPKETKFEKNGGTSDDQFDFFTSPKLGYVNGVLVVLAQAKNIASIPKTCTMVEGSIVLKNNVHSSSDHDVLGKAFVKNSENPWKKQIIFENKENCTDIVTALTDDKNINVYFVNSPDESFSNWDFKLVYNIPDGDNSNGIRWNPVFKNLKDNFKLSTGNSEGIIPVAGGGFGIVTETKVVTPVMYKKNNKVFSTIMKFEKGKKDEYALLQSKIPANCVNPAIVEWNDKLVMMTSCSDGWRKVYESDNMGEKWTEAVASLSGVWGNTKDRTEKEYGGVNGFITAKIGEGEKKEVMLVTHLVWNDDKKKYRLHLWMTDYKRVYDVGAISAEADEDTSSTLLYAQGNLFAAYEKWETNKATINIKHLKNELTTIKDVLQKWKEQDEKLSKSCIAADGKIKDDTCKNTIPTNGLVGFLSDGYNDGKWVDKYMCVNATVKNNNQNKVTPVDGGLKFSGAGAGAVWPVGAQGQNQRYHFANFGFTLVATVKIDGGANNNKKENSILGFNYIKNSNKLSFGLWCTKDGHWRVSEGEEGGELNKNTAGEKCDKNKIYEVALTLRDKKVSVYINGEKIKELTDKAITAQQPLSITHFYFGADNNAQTSTAVAESYVTVTNVLLYNRPFDDREIRKLKKDFEEESDLALPPLNKYSALRVHVGVLFFMFALLALLKQ